MQRSLAVQPVRAVARPTRNRPRRRAAPNPWVGRLYRRFRHHTANFVGNVANSQLQDAASGIANTCVSFIPAANSVPALKLLARELAKRLVHHARAKNRVAALVRTCGPHQSAALLAISVVTFLHALAQQWGSPVTIEDVAALLLEHLPLITAFVTGKHVDVMPILEELLPPVRYIRRRPK